MNIDEKKQQIQARYNTICSQYGDAQFKVEFWMKRKEELQKEMVALDQEQAELLKKTNNVHSIAAEKTDDGSSTEDQASQA